MELKCRNCRECNGIACRGEIPGVGGKDTGRSFINNYNAWKNITLNMDVCSDPEEVSTAADILGITMKMPVFIAPIAGMRNNYGFDIDEYDYNKIVVDAAYEAGIRAFTGDGIDVENLFKRPASAIHDNGGHGIVTVKPWVKEGIDERMTILENINYEMLATDIDAAGLPLLRKGKTPVETKNSEALRYLKEKCGKPLIVKGVMTVHAAETALKAGADAIVVSNHGGRVLDDCRGTAEVLPEIVNAVGTEMTVLVDGGIRSGMDVFKALALGADGVLIGRPMALSVVNGGKDGLLNKIDMICSQLKETMLMTGCHSIQDITIDKVYKM